MSPVGGGWQLVETLSARAKALGATLGLDRLFIKDESLNPTNSFKARGLSAAISRAKALKAETVSLPTAGNAGNAAAAYAATAGMKCEVFIPKDAKLTPWPKDLLKEWDTLSADEKKLFIRQADVYAAYLAYTDHEIGRVIQAVEDMGKLDNTLIIYISGDNGSSAEGSVNGTPNEVMYFNGVALDADKQMAWYDVWGTDQTYNHMAVGWTWAFDTPYRWTKQVASHFGGTRNGMAISWPAKIKDRGGIRTQFHHVIDVVPTILDLAGIERVTAGILRD